MVVDQTEHKMGIEKFGIQTRAVLKMADRLV
jgi:hypothetical protein